MPGLFSRFKGRDGAKSKKKNAATEQSDSAPPKPKWDDAYTRKSVEPEEIHELIRCCTEELKARALDHPFLLLPFRPTSDPSAVRTFIRHFFDQPQSMRGDALIQEIRLAEPMVIAGVTKWCWSRLQGGVVGWDAYELFKVGEFDSNMARDSFKTFIPISIENGARQRIIFDFFDLMAALAAHGKANGFGGRKLSRMAAWWAFEQKDTSNGFEGGYAAWLSAADAASHLFFAYLRSLSPEQGLTGVSLLPMSLQKLIQETEYPPQRPELMMSRTNRVVMVVDSVSPTPFALLRRANHFQYRDSDKALQQFSAYDDPIQALTEECRRVLKAVSAANQSQASSSKHSTSLRDASWSRFEDIGFTSALEEEDEEDELAQSRKQSQGLRNAPASEGGNMGRPTTPSWADFLSSGFIDESHTRSNLLLPPDKVLPPIDTQIRQRSSQSHRPRLESERDLEPGELASITMFDLDDAFWWVWMSSLSPEETPERKSAFGRCAVVETSIKSGRWLVMEEMVAGAAPEPQEGAYIAEKKGFFSWTRRSNKTIKRRRSESKQTVNGGQKSASTTFGISKTSIGPDTHAKIQAKAAQLRAAEDQERRAAALESQRRGRPESDLMRDKTNSVLTLQPNILGEASSAMKWVSKYDKGAIKEAYLANDSAGRGMAISPSLVATANGHAGTNGYHRPEVPEKEPTPKPAEPAPVEPTIPVQPEEPQKEISRKPVGGDALDKAEEAGVHPAERVEPEETVSPAPPPKDEEPPKAAREEVKSPEPTPSPESKKKDHKRLHKEYKEKKGFRKLFGRKDRSSKLPENASADLNTMLSRTTTTESLVEDYTPSATPSQAPASIASRDDEAGVRTPGASGADAGNPMEGDGVETPRAAHTPEPTFDPKMGDNLSQIDSRDEAEARREFSRFDQGPLDDQPAFSPHGAADEEDEDDATPPPIARHPQRSPDLAAKHNPKRPEDVLSQSAQPGVQDRWAQIRKNAAERAAHRQSEEQSRGGQSKTTDGDDDTSGEETIESRVARIKARVAELTGNMEGTSSPGQGSPGQVGSIHR